jgi:hypothetical protein
MRKVIRRHIRERSGGVDVAADVNAVIAVNDGSSRTQAVQSTSVQSTSIVQGTSARAGDDVPPPAAPKDDSPQEER